MIIARQSLRSGGRFAVPAPPAPVARFGCANVVDSFVPVARFDFLDPPISAAPVARCAVHRRFTNSAVPRFPGSGSASSE